MAAIVYNLAIEQGATFYRTFELVWPIAIQCAANGSINPITQLHIQPLPVPIPTGFALEFSCDQVLTVAAPYAAGDRFLMIDPYIGSVKNRAVCDGPPIDKTSSTFVCQIRDSFDGAVIAEPQAIGELGLITLSLPYAAVEALPATLRREDLPPGDPEAIVQVRQNTEKYYTKALVYQVEETVGVQRRRVLEGRVFVLREVVRAQV